MVPEDVSGRLVKGHRNTGSRLRINERQLKYMTKAHLEPLIKQEERKHKTIAKGKSGRSADYEKGFVAGLKFVREWLIPEAIKMRYPTRGWMSMGRSPARTAEMLRIMKRKMAEIRQLREIYKDASILPPATLKYRQWVAEHEAARPHKTRLGWREISGN